MRVDALFDDERARYHAGLGPMLVGSGAARRLEAAAAEVGRALAATGPEGFQAPAEEVNAS